jgi:hypothetical protein
MIRSGLCSEWNGFTSFNRTNCRVLSRAFGAFHIIINLVQAPLVERVFAQEMYGRKVHGPATCRTASSLEDSRFATELLDLPFLGFSFRSIAFDKSSVLESQLPSRRSRCARVGVHWRSLSSLVRSYR